MKILLLSKPSAPHTVKWANALNEKGNELIVFGFTRNTQHKYRSSSTLKVISAGINASVEASGVGKAVKFSYLRILPQLRKIIKGFKPDILHAHFASSYGLIGALAGFRPYILSVWGTDVYEFPDKNILCKSILTFNLKKADKILSTSHVMAKRAANFTNKSIEITPFGVDTKIFSPQKVRRPFSENDIVVGTVKTLEKKYGVEYLIRAFAEVKHKLPQHPLKLLIVGGGSLEIELKSLVIELGINGVTLFTGNVAYEDVPNYHNMIDVEVFLSITDSESFGVAAIEAGACEKSVVVANVGGLPEVVEDGRTGLIVPAQNVERAAEAIEMLVLNKSLRNKLGRAGRQKVLQEYEWNNSVEKMISIYHEVKQHNYCGN